MDPGHDYLLTDRIDQIDGQPIFCSRQSPKSSARCWVPDGTITPSHWLGPQVWRAAPGTIPELMPAPVSVPGPPVEKKSSRPQCWSLRRAWSAWPVPMTMLVPIKAVTLTVRSVISVAKTVTPVVEAATSTASLKLLTPAVKSVTLACDLCLS